MKTPVCVCVCVCVCVSVSVCVYDINGVIIKKDILLPPSFVHKHTYKTHNII